MEPKARILLAEADRDCRSAFMWCLLSEGYWVEPVASFLDAALALDRRDLPELAVIDLGLSGVPGRKLIEHMRGTEKLARIPIVATSFAHPVVPLPPGVEFLKKPCDPQRLVEKVRAAGGAALPNFFSQLRRAGTVISRLGGNKGR